MAVTGTIANPVITSLPIIARSENRCWKQWKNVGSSSVRLKPLSMQFQSFDSKRNVTRSSRMQHASVICAAALAQRDKTRSSDITVAPGNGGGTGPPPLPPYYRGGGGGGDGGGGGGRSSSGHWWWGAYILFGILVFIVFWDDVTVKDPYSDESTRQQKT